MEQCHSIAGIEILAARGLLLRRLQRRLKIGAGWDVGPTHVSLGDHFHQSRLSNFVLSVLVGAEIIRGESLDLLLGKVGFQVGFDAVLVNVRPAWRQIFGDGDW